MEEEEGSRGGRRRRGKRELGARLKDPEGGGEGEREEEEKTKDEGNVE